MLFFLSFFFFIYLFIFFLVSLLIIMQSIKLYSSDYLFVLYWTDTYKYSTPFAKVRFFLFRDSRVQSMQNVFNIFKKNGFKRRDPFWHEAVTVYEFFAYRRAHIHFRHQMPLRYIKAP